MLPSGNVISRPLNLLYPLETASFENVDRVGDDQHNTSTHQDDIEISGNSEEAKNTNLEGGRSKRKPGIIAREKLKLLLRNHDN